MITNAQVMIGNVQVTTRVAIGVRVGWFVIVNDSVCEVMRKAWGPKTVAFKLRNVESGEVTSNRFPDTKRLTVLHVAELD